MADLIPFPHQSRTTLIRSLADDLSKVHGHAANVLWRNRIADIAAEMRAGGLCENNIRAEIYGVQDAVQIEMQRRDQISAVCG